MLGNHNSYVLTDKFRKSVTSLLLLWYIISYTTAQTLPTPKIESPNLASLGKLGDVPVSLFTGVPYISIPVHTLFIGKIEVPIALGYHPASIKAIQHPDWVGLGLNLESIGYINRKINANYDEYCFSNLPGENLNGYALYYPYSSCTNTSSGPSGGEKIDVSN